MRQSKLFGKTSKTEGLDYKIPSHGLLTRAGYIRESTAGRYFLLPLGLKVHENIISIVRKHMGNIGAQEVLTPVLHPIELWEETNRTTTVSFELMKVKDRRGAEFALGGTAEEMFVDLVRRYTLSYRDLPFNIYQFSMKFRDELRARGGLLRLREFIMKDAYSFSTEEQFEDVYKQMWSTYKAIFDELGLQTDVVAADNGYIGGEYSHEFIVPSDIGESRYFVDDKGQYAAHEDVAVVKIDDKNVSEELEPLEEVKVERGTTMEDGVAIHNLPLWQQTKDVLFFDEATKRYVLAVIRGDLDVNETKLMHAADAWELRAATEDEIRNDLQSEPGFISPVKMTKKGVKSGFDIVVIADTSLRTVRNMYGGANKKNRDLLNVNIDRDFTPDIEADIALAQTGMEGAEGGILTEKRGIEVGNIFQLGYHYTNLMTGAEYTDKDGDRQKYYMGCYGLGIARTLAAIVEIYHDEKGIVWPESVAPFKYHLVEISGGDEKAKAYADELYEKLTNKGIEVLYDDRSVSAGEKFADSDLLGIPYRLVVSKKTLEQGKIEQVERKSGETSMLAEEEIIGV